MVVMWPWVRARARVAVSWWGGELRQQGRGRAGAGAGASAGGAGGATAGAAASSLFSRSAHLMLMCLIFFSKLLLIVVLSKVATTCLPASSFLHYAFSSRTRTLRVLRPPASTTCFWVLATDSAHGHASIISASSSTSSTSAAAPAAWHYQQRGTTSPQQQHVQRQYYQQAPQQLRCVVTPVRERKKCVATVANIGKFTYVHLNCNKQ